MTGAIGFLVVCLLAQCVSSEHDESQSHVQRESRSHDHKHGENTEGIQKAAKKYLGLAEFGSGEEFVFNVLKRAGANVNMAFSAESWGSIDQWGEDMCWKGRQSHENIKIHLGDVISNKTYVGIVTNLDPGRTATVIDGRVREIKMGFRDGGKFVVWCYVCDLPHEDELAKRIQVLG